MQRYICENKIRMRLFLSTVHSRTLFMCEHKSAVRFSCFSSHRAQAKLLSSTNLLCYSVGVSQRRVILSLSIFPSLPFASPGIHFVTPALSSSHLLFLIQESTFLQSVRNAVSGARTHTHTRYVPYESVFLLLSN